MDLLADPVISRYLFEIVTVAAGAVTAILLIILLSLSAIMEARGEDSLQRARRALWTAILPLLLVFSALIVVRMLDFLNAL